jgi:hypothetical protein
LRQIFDFCWLVFLEHVWPAFGQHFLGVWVGEVGDLIQLLEVATYVLRSVGLADEVAVRLVPRVVVCLLLWLVLIDLHRVEVMGLRILQMGLVLLVLDT